MSLSPFTLPPPPLEEGLREAIAAGAWVCRSCACILRTPYRYAQSPWSYCHRCGGTLTPDEQLVALARLQMEGHAPPLLSPTSNAKSIDTERPLLTVAEVAAFYGKSEQAVFKMISRGQVAGVTRVGRRLYVRRADLLRSLTEGRVPSPGRSR